jgi:hypothetical protein
MLRSFAVKSAIAITAVGGIFLLSPMTLSAGAVTPSAAVTVMPEGSAASFLVYTGRTYPDTPAGKSACDAEGEYDVSHSNGEDVAYICELGNPNAGVYNLWVWVHVP